MLINDEIEKIRFFTFEIKQCIFTSATSFNFYILELNVSNCTNLVIIRCFFESFIRFQWMTIIVSTQKKRNAFRCIFFRRRRNKNCNKSFFFVQKSSIYHNILIVLFDRKERQLMSKTKFSKSFQLKISMFFIDIRQFTFAFDKTLMNIQF